MAIFRDNRIERFILGQNKGIDISGRFGDPVFAANKGEVVYSGRDDVQGIGNLLIIRHGERYLSAYGHNSRMLVTEGDTVDKVKKLLRLGIIRKEIRYCILRFV